MLPRETIIDHASFVGLLNNFTGTINQTVVEIYRLFPNDSNVSRTSGAPTFGTSKVPARQNLPADIAFQVRDGSAGTLTFSTTSINNLGYSILFNRAIFIPCQIT